MSQSVLALWVQIQKKNTSLASPLMLSEQQIHNSPLTRLFQVFKLLSPLLSPQCIFKQRLLIFIQHFMYTCTRTLRNREHTHSLRSVASSLQSAYLQSSF